MTQPPQHPPYPGHGPSTERPKEVELSFRLWVAHVVLAALAAGYVFFGVDTIVAEILEAQGPATLTNLDEAGQRAAVTAGVLFGAVFSLALTGLQLLFAFLMRRGQNFARLTLAVLGGVTILYELFPFAQSRPDPVVIGNMLSVLLAAAAIVVMYLPNARPWFRRLPSYYQ